MKQRKPRPRQCTSTGTAVDKYAGARHLVTKRCKNMTRHASGKCHLHRSK